MLTQIQKRKLIKLFSMYDADNLGVLKLPDFERVAHKLAQLKGWKPGSSDYQTLLDKYAYLWIHMRAEIKNKINHKLESQVTIEEWLKYHEIVLDNQEYKEEIKSIATLVFDAVDLDENGNIDRQEWKNLFQVYNIPVVYLEESFSQIDCNHDGLISKEELLSSLKDFYYSQDPDATGNFMFGPY